MRKAKVGVLISGGGSNLQALIDAAESADFPAEIVCVISNKQEAYGLTRADKAGIQTDFINHRDYSSRAEFEEALHQTLLSYDVDIVCLAGFMRILEDEFVQKWQGKMLNIHPSLLPKYKGLNTHARAIEAGDEEAGCTVHWVVPELDAGPIIAQASVAILSEDTAESLAARVLVEEHRIYPEALKAVATGLKIPK
jgi:phosphoribosylglycinamide formyltransferase-1